MRGPTPTHTPPSPRSTSSDTVQATVAATAGGRRHRCVHSPLQKLHAIAVFFGAGRARPSESLSSASDSRLRLRFRPTSGDGAVLAPRLLSPAIDSSSSARGIPSGLVVRRSLRGIGRDGCGSCSHPGAPAREGPATGSLSPDPPASPAASPRAPSRSSSSSPKPSLSGRSISSRSHGAPLCSGAEAGAGAGAGMGTGTGTGMGGGRNVYSRLVRAAPPNAGSGGGKPCVRGSNVVAASGGS